MKRRAFLSMPAAAVLAGCSARHDIEGGFTGIDIARGHAWRDGALPAGAAPDAARRTRVVIAGGGVAGLAAARALRLSGVEDFVLLELEDTAGGNSRAGAVQGIACPLGAHYLPLPGDDAHEVQDLLEELGLRRRVSGRWEYDERQLCHSPQERLFFQGSWQDGLLPLQGVGAATLAQYRRFSRRVEALGREGLFTIPTLRTAVAPTLLELDAQSFEAWLGREGFSDPQLRWYLDYCCRDDYGAGLAHVSAWAGIHYFASRHGFHAPGDEDSVRDAVLTWPEGNAWLTRRLAQPLGDRLRTGHAVTRIAEQRSGVEVDAVDAASGRRLRWQAERCIVALPVFVAARVVEAPPERLRQAAAALRHAPWLVANIHLRAALADRPGAAPSWDNVIHGSRGLGYVDARHQALDPTPGPTVLSWYRPLGPSGWDGSDSRRLLLERPWTGWRDELLAELSVPHPDLAGLATRIDITRYGHAMAIPAPGLLATLGAPERVVAGRLAFAHADWSGYSIFEEAFTRGHLAGTA
ncbi:FAD-dependent oxidoreductase [Variovorax saccharolyticus]|uniref:FAD-dependent oxidoreductase n=1 Tax=Variovorax saccharolyticus TaxID=3053516 RepID=UPI00257873D4|nr:FAD-dependent oxidoreductase [Variovorax sp. J31P216]MDM0030249.1 FAD-dependent oxidoreductase [Variovorax sp. J31P216]